MVYEKIAERDNTITFDVYSTGTDVLHEYGGSDWVGKWQLREYQYSDGKVQKVDSIFYGFQKGSFLAYCMNENGNYESFYGYYKLKDDEISITLWPITVPETRLRMRSW